MMNKVVYFTPADTGLFDDDPFITVLTAHGMSISSFAQNGLATSYTDFNDIINGLVAMTFNDRFAEYYIYKKEYDFFDETTPSLTSSEENIILRRVLNVIEATCLRYIPLLKQYTANQTDPIGKISSTSSGSTRFNDTPQDGGAYSDDTHTTNITESESTSSVDVGSIMQRLNDLYINWRAVIKDWCNEFRGILMEVWR